ncbi:MAG TPA: hypothetical protein VFV49_16885 [Thermoanaerobaculia bacterium]|nr:hypothetical protein [Thermoanaerobaculia bacterium]
MAAPQYETSVFVNCPFDDAYRDLFQALVFAIHDCGYVARCALELQDGSQVRIEKIALIIAECRLGIHDISRTELDVDTGLPRFNMPFELGMFVGAKRYGRAEQKRKNGLILDTDRYRYQNFISDIAGQDVSAHGGDPSRVIRVVRDWLSDATPASFLLPSGSVIANRFRHFRKELPGSCALLDLRPDELTFNDYVIQVEQWLRLNSHVSI